MEQIRSFIAIELPGEVKEKLTQLQRQLKRNQSWIKWVGPAGIHLTLKFLGNIDAGKVEEVLLAMEEAAQDIPAFRLEVKDTGVFPNLNRVQVVWVGLSGELDKLSRLQQQLEANLAQLGFAVEERSFTPHLTIARLRNDASPAERQALGRVVTGTKFEGGIINVVALSLMRSQLTREGAIYTRVGEVRLK
ncbi:MAG: RNA 2',3'-cyclic phosphodiesterase [Chloroflexota bacterium]